MEIVRFAFLRPLWRT